MVTKKARVWKNQETTHHIRLSKSRIGPSIARFAALRQRDRVYGRDSLVRQRVPLKSEDAWANAPCRHHTGQALGLFVCAGLRLLNLSIERWGRHYRGRFVIANSFGTVLQNIICGNLSEGPFWQFKLEVL